MRVILYLALIIAGTMLAVTGAVVWEALDPGVRATVKVVWQWVLLALYGSLLVSLLRKRKLQAGPPRLLLVLIAAALALQLVIAVFATLERW
ncbi:MAG TPA: hypothetical protein VFQ45_09115 [Longimicrobium sp.]|nr:hypothetical protein [Longimicrobium sp.]